MSIKDRIADLATRLAKAKARPDLGEEATKTAVVLPFLSALGFDVFDPHEVQPEFVADVGVKKGEKVDYAITIHNRIEYIIEAKPLNASLSTAQYSQLYRYFGVTDARIAILTNGADYWFFTDIDAANKMDEKPFFKFSLEAYDEADLRELEKFSKDVFSIEQVQETASGLKYSHLAGAYLAAQLQEPDDDFVRLVARSFYDGMLTASVMKTLKPNVKRAFDDLIRQRVRQRLEVALGNDSEVESEPLLEEAPSNRNEIQTTDEEWRAFYIIQAIGSEVTDVSNIAIRDAKAYCAVLFGDNNRKPICRLLLEGKTKSVIFFDAEKNEERVYVDGPDDLYKHKARIKGTIARYAGVLEGA